MADLDLIPEICREVTAEWNREVENLGEVLMGMLSERLGLSVERLKEMSCLEARVMVAHYYPRCPEPDRTLGLSSHSDPGVLTVLLQDQVGGLQVKYQGDWIHVKPLHGALVINVGDILQLESIGSLEQFLIKHRRDYVDLHRTTEQERDSIEHEANLIRTAVRCYLLDDGVQWGALRHA